MLFNKLIFDVDYLNIYTYLSNLFDISGLKSSKRRSHQSDYDAILIQIFGKKLKSTPGA